ncbi:DUF3987 domain-containing protein [Streptomyces purpureus]|uniref:DUF3987 domain-containing protein n=1 Tax=Streptomyces purpureus TaxID=1951 RepID=UPI00036D1A01|nr:DUF3987 domain-containing protein [Streptomyces purpureus]
MAAYRQSDNSGNWSGSSGASPGWEDIPDTLGPNNPDGSYYAADAVLERLSEQGYEWTEVGKGKWNAQCPAHDGKKLKLSIAYGTENPDALLFTCFTGECTPEEIAAALDMTVYDFFNRDGDGETAEEPAAESYEPPTEKREKPVRDGKSRLIETYPYPDVTGVLLYERRRFEPGFNGERKSVTTRRPDGRGGWITRDVFKGPDAPPHIPYNAPDLHQAAVHGDPVILTEGERAADRLMSLGYTATTLDGGAGAAWTPFLVGQFAGVGAVRLFMDDDEQGAGWVRNAVAALSPVVAEITVHRSATGKRGDDVVDHLDAGHTIEELIEVPLSAFRAPEHEWPDPPMPLDSPKLPPFPVHLLGNLEPIVRAVSAAFQCPADYAAICALGALDTVLGGRVQVRLKPDWLEKHTGKFLMGFGEPSDGKSLAQDEMFAPLRAVLANHAAAVAPFLHDELLVEALGYTPDPPRGIMEDTTFEPLICQLGKHGGRMALVSDEGGIFKMLGGMYAGTGQKSNDEILRKGYSGGSYTYDRKGTSGKGESVHIPVVKLSICILAQPGILRGMEAANPNFRASGFLARILYALPAPLPHYVLDVPDIPVPVRDAYARTIHTLFERFWLTNLPYTFTPADSSQGWDAVDGGSIEPHKPVDPVVLTLPDSMRDEFLKFNVDLRQRAKQSGNLHGIADWVGKLAGSTARVAAVLTLADNPEATKLSPRAVRDAMAMTPYWTAHARHAFRLMSRAGSANAPAIHVRDWVRTHTKRGETFSLSEVHQAMRHQTSWYETKEDAEAALAGLERYGWVRRIENTPKAKTGRPPSPRFLAHPLTYRLDDDVDDAADGVFSVFSGTHDVVTRAPEPEERVLRVFSGTHDVVTEEPKTTSITPVTTSQNPLKTLETRRPKVPAPQPKAAATPDRKRRPPKRLTDEQKDAVRAAYANGSTMDALAEQYGVSKSVIHRVIPDDARRPRGTQKKGAV